MIWRIELDRPFRNGAEDMPCMTRGCVPLPDRVRRRKSWSQAGPPRLTPTRTEWPRKNCTIRRSPACRWSAPSAECEFLPAPPPQSRCKGLPVPFHRQHEGLARVPDDGEVGRGERMIKDKPNRRLDDIEGHPVALIANWADNNTRSRCCRMASTAG